MKVFRKNVAVAVLAATAALTPASFAYAAEAHSPGTSTMAAPAASGFSGSVDIISGATDIAERIYNIASYHAELNNNRAGLVRGLREAAWFQAGEPRNVLVIKAKHPYTLNLRGIYSDAIYKYRGYPDFRVIVFDSGTVTNRGDGGYINWSFRGWFTRNGMTVTFRKP